MSDDHLFAFFLWFLFTKFLICSYIVFLISFSYLSIFSCISLFKNDYFDFFQVIHIISISLGVSY